MMLSLPRVIGHRGACAHAPENTVLSFVRAAELGCRMVEFDVRLTVEGIAVVFHDDTLERCTSGRGAVAERSWRELSILDAGRGQRIARLSDVLALCAERGLSFNMEIKPDRERAEETARIALRETRRLWPRMLPLPLISSFERRALAVARREAPEWPRGLLVGAVPGDWRTASRRLGCIAIHADQRRLNPWIVQAIRAEGLMVLAYTVNTAPRARRLWRLGVDAVFCDAPERLLALERNG